MQYKVILEPQPESGYTVFVPALPDVITEGETKEDALTNAKDAIVNYLEVMKEMGWRLPRLEEATIEVV